MEGVKKDGAKLTYNSHNLFAEFHGKPAEASKYEGKSAMQLYLCFCWQHCCFAQHRHAWFPCHYFCAGLMLLGQFHHRCLAINHGCSAFCLHQRRATFSDPVFVVGRCIRGHNPSKTFSTIQEQCFAAMECLRMD
jgi:hypothetical protein